MNTVEQLSKSRHYGKKDKDLIAAMLYCCLEFGVLLGHSDGQFTGGIEEVPYFYGNSTYVFGRTSIGNVEYLTVIEGD